KTSTMNKRRLLFGIITGIFIFMISCTKWDDFKKYTKDGETIYTGKIDSVKIYSGNLRARIVGILPADPKIIKLKILWGRKQDADSVVFPISKQGNSEVFDT